MTTSSPRGFTLLEISIVLIIIGLVIGGILVGRDIIRSAEIRQTVTQKQQFETAASTFKLKFGCLPADCPSPTSLGFSGGNGSAGGNADGDGVIYYGGNFTTGYWFWQQLYESGLGSVKPAYIRSGFTFAGDASPPCLICDRTVVTIYGAPYPIVGGWQVVDMQKIPSLSCGQFVSVFAGTPIRGRSFMLTKGNIGTQSPGYETIKAADAQAIDAKMDDGKPLTGSVIAVGSYYYTDTALSGCGGFLNTDTALSRASGGTNISNTYLTTTTGYTVDVIMKAGF